MKKIKKENLILEFNNFDINLNPVIDNSVSFKQTINNLETNITNKISMLNTIASRLKSSNEYTSIIRSINLSDIELEKMTILRIYENNSYEYDVFIIFTLNGEEYWGVIYDILSNSPDFRSELLGKVSHRPNEWVVRIKGKIINIILEWLKVDKGEYELLNDYNCYSKESGTYYKISKGAIINVVRIDENKIYFEYENNVYFSKNKYFIYFRYWTKKVEN